MPAAGETAEFVDPGASLGLFEVVRRRYLLSLLINKEVAIRYRGSALGWIWSYTKPLIQFAVFYVALGVFLGMNQRVPNYPIYLLSGITVSTFFNESLWNSTRSLLDNAALIKKIYLPREMFPIASVIVAAINAIPQIIVIAAISIFLGWSPSLVDIAGLLLGFLIAAIFATGLGLFFGSINVSFRDSQSFVEIVTMVSVWGSPIMYQWQMVQASLPHWLFVVYQLNPITASVALFHRGLWGATPLAADIAQMPHLWLFSLWALIIAIGSLVIGQLVFRKLEGRFAQDL